MGRRANREGSVYKRKDGRWTAAITINNKRLYHHASTQRECLNGCVIPKTRLTGA
jgi:hypothetical protein